MDGGGDNCVVRDAKPSMANPVHLNLSFNVFLTQQINEQYFSALAFQRNEHTLMDNDHKPRPTHLVNYWTKEKQMHLKETADTLMQPLDTALLAVFHT